VTDGAPPGFGPWFPPEGRRRRAVRALAAMLLLLEVEALWNVVGIAAVGRLVEVPAAWYPSYDLVTQVLAGLHLLLLAPAAVLFIAWQRLLIRNSQFLGCEAPSYGPTLAACSWFVPFLNLALPLLSLLEVARWSRLPGRSGGPLLPLWWGAWVLNGPVVAVGVLLTTLDQGPDLWILGTAINAAGTLLLIASGVLALRVVNGLTRQQEERARGLADWSSTGPELQPSL
jgi:hypothetical protein